MDLGIAQGDTTQPWVILIGGLSDRVTQPHMAVTATTGNAPLNVMGTDRLLRPTFRIVLQGATNGYADAETKAYEVWDALHRKPFGNFIAVEGTNAPAWLGYSEDNHKPRWSLNFSSIRK